MRILVVGDPEVEAGAASVFGGRHDVTFQAVKTAAEVAKRLDDGESTLVFLHGGEAELASLPEMTSRGALVVVVAEKESAAFRRSALAGGARDLLFAPVDGPSLQACAESVLGVPGRRHPRFETEAAVTLVPVTVAVEGAAPHSGRLRNLSAGGFRADLPGAIERGALVTLDVDADPKPPSLPARVLACEPAGTAEGLPGPQPYDTAASRVHARFVGLMQAERAALDRLIDRLRR